ncbi:septal ring lytic transglycosylase RlpA family protein [Methyloligella sp. GL2]|uniref:septal ring lytic transglycosylase RlpA family protein n=1 Tax=unclassified Methyloligella TaxID=2625955 RepID=UPI00352E4852
MAVLPISLASADQVGHASWYALHSRTASGEMMNPSAMTAAHRSLPFGTKVLVENLNNGRKVVVRINDRGPFVGGRIIDVSKAAASNLGMISSGTAQVRISTVGSGTRTSKSSESSVRGKMANVSKSASKTKTAVRATHSRSRTAAAQSGDKKRYSGIFSSGGKFFGKKTKEQRIARD